MSTKYSMCTTEQLLAMRDEAQARGETLLYNRLSCAIHRRRARGEQIAKASYGRRMDACSVSRLNIYNKLLTMDIRKLGLVERAIDEVLAGSA